MGEYNGQWVGQTVRHSQLIQLMTDARRVVHLSAIFRNRVRTTILLLLVEHAVLSVTELATMAQVSVTLTWHHQETLRVEGWVTVAHRGRARAVRVPKHRDIAVRQLLETARLMRDQSAEAKD